MYAGRDRRLALRSREVLNKRWSEEAHAIQLNKVVNEDWFEMYGEDEVGCALLETTLSVVSIDPQNDLPKDCVFGILVPPS